MASRLRKLTPEQRHWANHVVGRPFKPELTPRHWENYSEAVRANVCVDAPPVKQALSFAETLADIWLNDGVRLTPQAFHDGVDEDARRRLTPLLPLMTLRMRRLGRRRAKRAHTAVVKAVARARAKEYVATRSYSLVKPPRAAPRAPRRSARMRTPRLRRRAGVAQRDGPSEPSPSPPPELDLARGVGA